MNQQTTSKRSACARARAPFKQKGTAVFLLLHVRDISDSRVPLALPQHVRSFASFLAMRPNLPEKAAVHGRSPCTDGTSAARRPTDKLRRQLRWEWSSLRPGQNTSRKLNVIDCAQVKAMAHGMSA